MAQVTILDTLLKNYSKTSISYSVNRVYFSTLSNSTFTNTAYINSVKNKNERIYRVEYNPRYDAIKTKKYYGTNNFVEKIYVNYYKNNSDLFKPESEFLSDFIFSPDSFKFNLSNKSRYLVSRNETPNHIIITQLDTNRRYSNDEIALFRQVSNKYFISKKSNLIEKILVQPIVEFNGMEILDSTLYLFSYFQKSVKEVTNRINNFIPLKDTVKKLSVPDNIKDSTIYFPDFVGFDTTLNVFNSSSIKSQLVLVEFWYKSCGPCLANMKELEKVRKKYRPEDLEIIALNIQDEVSLETKKLIKKGGYTFKFIFGKKKELSKLRIIGFPTTYIYNNSTKKIILNHLGGGPSYSEEIINFINLNLTSPKN